MAEDERGRRIVSDLHNAFKRDSDIDEFGFIPCPEALQNKSPVILEQHKLGLESWSVPLVFQYAYTQLIQARQKLIRLAPQDLISCSRAVLLINPECYTVWNIRKELINSDHLDIKTDLRFSSLILTRQPKSPETFAHRKWLLLQLLKVEQDQTSQDGDANSYGVSDRHAASHNRNLQSGSIELDEKLISDEFAVCTLTAERYPSNYGAWSHRIWTIQHLTRCSQQLLLAELTRTRTLVSMHVSDHSGFHYRQFLIKELAKSSNSQDDLSSTKLEEVLESEIKLAAELIESYPGHEAIWYHRRFLFHLKCHLLQQEDSTKSSALCCPKINNATTQRQTHCNSERLHGSDIPTNLHSPGYDTQVNPKGKKFRADGALQCCDCDFYNAELRFIERCLEDVHADDSSVQARCAGAYKKWLDFIHTDFISEDRRNEKN
ncbi:protein prenyltransferase alpha subunit repeat-containing protein 1-like [Ptychodera flava]|uniref:protein prenyltransferase alpha subunit repeat-containing protein 1-like n=1 Tax=Ptychodera flava TaxID=63121 RepID=UPI003969F569